MNPVQPAVQLLASSHLVLVLAAGVLEAWQVSPGTPPRSLLLQGEMRLSTKGPQSLISAKEDVLERLEDDGIHPVLVHWLLDTAGRQLWMQTFSQERCANSPPWQLLAWEWLTERFDLHHDRLQVSIEQLEHVVLPWLVSSNSRDDRQQLWDALAREHQDESERLATERAHLQRENEQLRAQNLALQQIDPEHLVSFLPALYPRVFTQLGAVDLALLCGRIEMLPIPNPYPEPSEEALHIMQKRFSDLPRELQRQIVRFVTHLPQRHKLVARPEMRALISELEET